MYTYGQLRESERKAKKSYNDEQLENSWDSDANQDKKSSRSSNKSNKKSKEKRNSAYDKYNLSKGANSENQGP